MHTQSRWSERGSVKMLKIPLLPAKSCHFFVGMPKLNVCACLRTIKQVLHMHAAQNPRILQKNWRKSRRFSRMGLAEASEAPFPHAKTAPRARLLPRQTSDLRPKNGLVVNYRSKHVYAVHMRIRNARWRAQRGAALSSFSLLPHVEGNAPQWRARRRIHAHKMRMEVNRYTKRNPVQYWVIGLLGA